MVKIGKLNSWREYLWYYAPLFVWIAIILVASSGTGSMSNTSRIIRPILEFLFPNSSESALIEIHGYIRKTAHLTFYAALGWLAARAFAFYAAKIVRKNWIIAAFLLTVSTAAVDETNQSFYVSRTGSVYDVLLDATGGALAVILFAAIWQRKISRLENA